MTSARDLIADASERLEAAGIGSSRVDAEWMLAAVLGVSRPSAAMRAAVPDRAAAIFAEHVHRRAGREPLQHIIGTAPFRHVEVAVGPGVFVPRPETELLVDAVLAHLRGVAEPIVVDLCAGSGALALAIASEVPGARVIAVERAASALRWLARNTSGTRVEVLAADVLDAQLLRHVRGQVDAVVCNPPYVPSATEVEPEVLADPHDAVFAGADGLAVIPVVARRASELLRAGGVLALEHSETHADDVRQMLVADGAWGEVVGHADLSGRARFATARRVACPDTAD